MVERGVSVDHSSCVWMRRTSSLRASGKAKYDERFIVDPEIKTMV